jgi:hypothetical protein
MNAAEIRIVVLDTTGPVDHLRVELWPRERAVAFHLRQPRTRKTPPVGTGRAGKGRIRGGAQRL